MRQPIRRRALVAAVLATAAPSVAATVDWLPTAPSPAPFSEPANWSTGTAPTSADAARFATGTAHTVTLTADTTTDQLLVADDDLALDLAGHTYGLANTSSTAPSLSLGSPAGSSLTLHNSTPATPGLLNLSYATIAPAAGDRADLTLSAGTSLNATGIDFRVAAYGTASLTLAPSSNLTTRSSYFAAQPGSAAIISVAGPGTRWNGYILQLAFSGSADLSVSGGASADASGQLVMAAGRGGTASATVTGQGSALTAGSLSVGQLGTATLLVQDGAAVSTKYDLGIGRGTATIDGASSSLSAGSYLYVGGYFGPAGATSGSATLNVRGGSVSSVGPLKLWNTPGTALNLSGGSLKIPYADPTSDLSRFHWTGGTLELTNSAFQVSNPTTVSPALNYIFNAGPTVSLTAGMALKISTPSSYTHYLVVDNGGILSATGASIAADDSVWVGYAGDGSLSLSDHASLASRVDVLIGHYYNSSTNRTFGNGTVTLDRNSSLAAVGTIYVGSNGSGNLTISGGSSVTSPTAYVAYGPMGGSATVDGPGSSWNTTGTLTIGKVGQGTLTISNGGAVATTGATIGNSNLEPTSSAAIQGPGSSWSNAGTLYVARGTLSTSRVNASLSLLDHASLSTNYLLAATTSSRANAALSISSGSALTVVTSAYLGGNATIAAGTATLSLTDSSATVGNTLKLHYTPNTSLALTRSTLTVGTPAAPGSLDNAAAISLADHSTLTLHGTLANAGTVSLSRDSLLLWDPASTPDPLATLRAQLATGHILPSPAAPANYRPAYTLSGEPTAPTSITITLALTGDTNLDGRIDPDDYALLDRASPRSLTDAHWTDGDFNYDGIINNQDYLLIDTAYGHAQGLSPQFLSLRESQFGPTYVAALLTSVPEPSSLACLFAGSLLLPRRRRR